MNNQDIVAMLEECWKIAVAGPVEPTDDAKEGLRGCRASLSTEMSSLLSDAVTMKWPFVPEKWQYKQAVTSEDKITLKELISRHLPQLLVFLRASISAGEPLWAASVVFLVDRFLYWVDTSNSLLKIAKALHKHYPATPIAPQVVIRQARLSLNSGKLQKAEYILSSLINSSGATGCWVYHADSDRVLVQAVSVQVRGQVLQKLGMWIEAADLIWASLIGMHELPEPDRKGIGTSLGLLANILVSMNDIDFQAFIAGQHMDVRLLKETGHRLLAAAEAAKMAVVYSQYDSLYVLTNVVTQGTCLLAYSFSPGCDASERKAILNEAKEAFQIGLLTKQKGEVVTSKQELHTLIKAAYSLTVTHKWLGSAGEQVQEASQVSQKAMEKLHAYSTVGSGERDLLGAEIMGLVARIKAVLGVEPFIKSDGRSFIPDSYRSVEENPVRFSMGRFSEVMGRFRKHHVSVCQARRMSCKTMALKRGVQNCSSSCVTAMQTTTETLDKEGATENFTNDNRPPGQRPDKQTKGGHLSQQCPTVFSDGEEMNGATRSEGHGLKGMSKERFTACSLRDRPASFTDARVRSKDRDAMSCASQKAEKWVHQKCLTEFDEEDGQNICSEGSGSLAGCGDSASGRSFVSSRCSSALPSSWESISSPDTGNKKVPNFTEARTSAEGSVTEWMEVGIDLHCETKGSEEVDMKAGTGSKGCRYNAVGKERTSSSSLRDGTPSFIDPKPFSKGKDNASHAKQRVKMWVDQQCPTEFSDEEVNNETNNDRQGIGKARTASSSLGDSMSSNSSWQNICLSETGSPVICVNGARRLSNNDTEEGWENLDCHKDIRSVAISISSPGDSLGSSSSWQKLSFSHSGSLLGGCRGVGCTAKERADVRVDLRCPTKGSDEEDLRDMGSFPVCALKPNCDVQCKTSASTTNAPKVVPAGHLVLRGDFHLLEPRHVDPKAETEDYVLGDLSMSTEYEEPEASAAESGSMGHFADPKSLRVMGNGAGYGLDFGKLCLNEYQQSTNNIQSHDQCLGKCMLSSEVRECSSTLTEQDYKALLSGVCHKCLLKRLNIKKTFRLRKYRTAYTALLLKYSKGSDCWMSRETMVYIGEPIGKEGCQRTVFWVQILHQEEILGSYVGKTYRFEKEIHYHLNDVERQMTAQHYVTEFNKRLYEKSIPAQIFFIPSEVLLILEGDVITDCVTVEPFMLGDFVKLTNNTVYTNQNYEATDYSIAFGHFTYQLSGGTEVVVDLQGWVTDNGKGLTYLTDPQIHSVKEGGSRTRHGERGIKQFLESQHGPHCNDICKALSLGMLQ